MFSIEDIWEILFDLEMASLYLEEQITYKLETHHWTRAQTWLAYPLFLELEAFDSKTMLKIWNIFFSS